VTAPTAVQGGTLRPQQLPDAALGVAITQTGVSAWTGGAGGGGGGGDGTNKGGGGGAGSGLLLICARMVVNNGGGTTAFRAIGGAPVELPLREMPAGGGGGGGGAIIIVSGIYIGVAPTSAAVAGGAAGSGSGTGLAGVNGSAGSIYLLQPA
jgi:hypothetical protein